MSNALGDMWLDLRIYIGNLEAGTTMTAREILDVMSEIEDENA